MTGKHAVNNSVIVSKRHIAHISNHYYVFAIKFTHYGTLLDGTDTHNRHLRLINYRSAKQSAESANVRDGECTALNVVGI